MSFWYCSSILADIYSTVYEEKQSFSMYIYSYRYLTDILTDYLLLVYLNCTYTNFNFKYLPDTLKLNVSLNNLTIVNYLDLKESKLISIV